MIAAYLTPDDVVQLAAHHFDVRVDELRGPSRRRPLALYRVAALGAARHLTGASLPEIGRAFGRHHTSVLNAVRRSEQEGAVGRYHDDLVRAISRGDRASGLAWRLALSCRCGWATELVLEGAPSIAEIADAARALARAERDHRHQGTGDAA